MKVLKPLKDYWSGNCITHFSEDFEKDSKNIYLTFDDGPDAGATEMVLKVLEKYKVHASFFVISEKAKNNFSLLKEIKSASHSIGDHSMDHRYKYFFQGSQALLKWITKSTEALNGLLGENNIGFRPPAGIRTPELHWVLKKLNIPLIHWKIRFFDRVVPWSPKRAKASLERTQSGDIILLHDAQPEKRIASFTQTLSIYIERALEMGFRFKSIRLSEGNCI